MYLGGEGAELLEICKKIFSSEFSCHKSWENVDFSVQLRKKRLKTWKLHSNRNPKFWSKH